MSVKHKTNLEKKRELRWKQPAANAKIEDLVYFNKLVSDSIHKTHQNSVNIGYTVDVLVETLIKKGIISKEDIDATAEIFSKKQKKFLELIADNNLTAEQKTVIAAEHEIDFDFLKTNG